MGRIGKTAGMLAALTLAAAAAAPAQAAVVVDIVQSGPDVVATASGSLNLTASPKQGTILGANAYIFTSPFHPVIEFGPATFVDAYLYSSGPTWGGSPLGTFIPDTRSGDAFSIIFNYVLLPFGYSSGTPISSGMTFHNRTLAGMGLIPGSYVWQLPNDQITLNISVPEPSTWVMMILGFGAVGGALRFARRRPADA